MGKVTNFNFYNLISEKSFKCHVYTRYTMKYNIVFSSNLVIRFNCYFKRKEGNVLFNDTLNTFYLRLYGVKHMVKHMIKMVRNVDLLFTDGLSWI